MEKLYAKDVLTNDIDKKIKYLCSHEERKASIETVNYLKELLKIERLFDYQKELIHKEINKILLYNI